MLTLCILTLPSLLFLFSCNSESSRTSCESNSDCDNGRICIDNFCRLSSPSDTENSEISDILETQEGDRQGESICTPDCFGRQCGPDPVCGELCGPDCPDGEYCLDGECELNPCTPDCFGLMCGPDPVCGELCGPACPAGEHCLDGDCEPDNCNPECNSTDCEVCQNNECISVCSDGESCQNGVCVVDNCDPPCTGDMSFCNEISQCAPMECEEFNCARYGPNVHCAQSFYGVSCFCNPGLILNDNQECVECEDDDISNSLDEPTEVELPLDHNGIMCGSDVFSFALEASITVRIDLDGFNTNLHDLEIMLLSDTDLSAFLERSDSDGFEHITFTTHRTQTYYLVVIPRSGIMPAEYHLTISDICGSEGCANLDYRYARIDDMTPRTGRGAPGADIDAVELRGPHGVKNFATSVVDSEILLGDQDDNDMMNFEEALGAPDNDCEMDYNFVALGGIGGFIVVEFGDSIIEVGDSIVVYEVGQSCGYDNEPLSLSVSVTNDRSGAWEAIGQAEGGEAVFNIEHLTPVSP